MKLFYATVLHGLFLVLLSFQRISVQVVQSEHQEPELPKQPLKQDQVVLPSSPDLQEIPKQEQEPEQGQSSSAKVSHNNERKMEAPAQQDAKQQPAKRKRGKRGGEQLEAKAEKKAAAEAKKAAEEADKKAAEDAKKAAQATEKKAAEEAKKAAEEAEMKAADEAERNKKQEKTSNDGDDSVKAPRPYQVLSYDELVGAGSLEHGRRRLQSRMTDDAMISGQGTEWERVYAQASNTSRTRRLQGWDSKDCSSGNQDESILRVMRPHQRKWKLNDSEGKPIMRVFPIDRNGDSVGPKLCSKHLPSPYNPDWDQRCVDKVEDLDSYLSLKDNNGVKFLLPDAMEEHHHMNVVNDRERHSSSSGAVFLDAEHFAICSFAYSTVYVYHLDPDTMQVTLLDKKLNRIPGGQTGGEYTELIDYNGRDMLVTGNLRTASYTLFKWNWETKKLKKLGGHFPCKGCAQMTHGVRFYPTNTTSSNVVASSYQKKQAPKTLSVRLYDHASGKERAALYMKNTLRYNGQGPQDVFFIDKYNLLVAYTPNRVTENLKRGEHCRNAEYKMKSYLVHYRLHFDLDQDDSTGNNAFYNSSHFEELQHIYYVHSHPDSIGYQDGIVIMSDQYNDHVTFVAVDPTGEKSMEHIGILTGYHMNHGVAFAPNLDYMAVTMYGDNSVIINRFPEWLEQKINEHRLSRQEKIQGDETKREKKQKKRRKKERQKEMQQQQE